MERTIIVEGFNVTFYLVGIKLFDLDCDNELEVRRVSKAWLTPPREQHDNNETFNQK